MKNSSSNKIYELLPVVHRTRDAEQGDVLRDLLKVIQQQASAVDNNISQGYCDAFIETCQPWVVPYLGDLVGITRPAADTLPDEEVSERERTRQRLLFPRGEVARAVSHYRRKGTLSVLEDLANDVAKWPARAVECHLRLAKTVSIHEARTDHSARYTLADFRQKDSLERLCTPFDDGMNLPLIGNNPDGTAASSEIGKTIVGVWRLKSYSMTNTNPKCLCKKDGITIYSFNPLGLPTQLYIKPEEELARTSIAQEHNLPAELRLEALKDPENPTQANAKYFGRGKSLSIRIANFDESQSDGNVSRKNIVPMDLSAFNSTPECKKGISEAQAAVLKKSILSHKIAVDPVNGFFAVPASVDDRDPPWQVTVSYHYGFSADIGGGEYRRPDRYRDPLVISKRIRVLGLESNDEGTPKIDLLDLVKRNHDRGFGPSHRRMHVSANSQNIETIVEFLDSRVYEMNGSDPVVIDVKPNERLVIKSVSGKRPVIQLHRDNCRHGLVFKLGKGSEVSLEGIAFSGNCVKFTQASQFEKSDSKTSNPNRESSKSAVNIRHCTIKDQRQCISGTCDGESLDIQLPGSIVRIENSIIGNIHLQNNSAAHETRLSVTDSIAGGIKAMTGQPTSNVLLRSNRSTFFGSVDVGEIYMVENCIFNEPVTVTRTQSGGIRYSYVPPESQTPGRFYCQPDLAVEAIMRQSLKTKNGQLSDKKASEEMAKIVPKFTSRKYNNASFGQLSDDCPVDIRQGAEDESEMGAFHDLYQSQREANLRQRLNEFSPISHSTKIKFAN